MLGRISRGRDGIAVVGTTCGSGWLKFRHFERGFSGWPDRSGSEIFIIFIRTNPLDLPDPRSTVFLSSSVRNVKPPATAGGTDNLLLYRDIVCRERVAGRVLELGDRLVQVGLRL